MDRIQKVCPALGNSATPPSEKSPPRPQLFRSLHGFPPGHGAPPLETLEKAKPEALLGPCLRWSVGEHGRCGSFPMWNNDEPCVVLLLEQWIFQNMAFVFGFPRWNRKLMVFNRTLMVKIFQCGDMSVYININIQYIVLWDDPANFRQHHPASKKWLGCPKYVLTRSMGSTFCLPCRSHFCLVNTLCLR